MPSSVNLTMVRGDTFPFVATIQHNNVALNLTGAQVRFLAKWKYEDADVDAVINLVVGSGITITDAIAGQVEVIVPATATTSLPARVVDLFYDLQATTSTNNVYTAMIGKLRVNPDVSIAATNP